MSATILLRLTPVEAVMLAAIAKFAAEVPVAIEHLIPDGPEISRFIEWCHNHGGDTLAGKLAAAHTQGKAAGVPSPLNTEDV